MSIPSRPIPDPLNTLEHQPMKRLKLTSAHGGGRVDERRTHSPDGARYKAATPADAMATTGAFNGRPPIEPWKAASPKLNTPPSDAASQ